MTKEELEKEAEEWLRKFLLCNDCKRKCHCIELNAYCEEQVLKAYIDGAEPREKQIQIDAKLIRALHKQNGELTDKVKELEAQIEKMKCCGNCKYRELIREHGQWKERFNCKGNGFVCHSKWEIKEK